MLDAYKPLAFSTKTHLPDNISYGYDIPDHLVESISIMQDSIICGHRMYMNYMILIEILVLFIVI